MYVLFLFFICVLICIVQRIDMDLKSMLLLLLFSSVRISHNWLSTILHNFNHQELSSQDYRLCDMTLQLNY